MVSGGICCATTVSFRPASYRHTYYRVRLIAEEERMTTELWRGGVLEGLGELGYAVALLTCAITAVMGCIGVLLCTIGANGMLATDFIERECPTSNDDQPSGTASSQGGPVTVRIEPGYSRFFRRRLCVVTIRKGLEDVTEVDRESWYAKDDG